MDYKQTHIRLDALFANISEILTSEIRTLRETDTDQAHDEADHITELRRELDEVQWYLTNYYNDKIATSRP